MLGYDVLAEAACIGIIGREDPDRTRAHSEQDLFEVERFITDMHNLIARRLSTTGHSYRSKQLPFSVAAVLRRACSTLFVLIGSSSNDNVPKVAGWHSRE